LFDKSRKVRDELKPIGIAPVNWLPAAPKYWSDLQPGIVSGAGTSPEKEFPEHVNIAEARN